MLKKIMLSAAFAMSTLAIAHINLDLSLTISHGENQEHTTGSITIDENEVTSIVFNGLESLVIDFIAAQSENDTIIMQAQFFQRVENDELIPIVEPLAVQVPEGQPATFTINEADDSGSLTLVVIPSLVH